jgi:hypothetical protein
MQSKLQQRQSVLTVLIRILPQNLIETPSGWTCSKGKTGGVRRSVDYVVECCRIDWPKVVLTLISPKYLTQAWVLLELRRHVCTD